MEHPEAVLIFCLFAKATAKEKEGGNVIVFQGSVSHPQLNMQETAHACDMSSASPLKGRSFHPHARTRRTRKTRRRKTSSVLNPTWHEACRLQDPSSKVLLYHMIIPHPFLIPRKKKDKKKKDKKKSSWVAAC